MNSNEQLTEFENYGFIVALSHRTKHWAAIWECSSGSRTYLACSAPEDGPGFVIGAASHAEGSDPSFCSELASCTRLRLGGGGVLHWLGFCLLCVSLSPSSQLATILALLGGGTTPDYARNSGSLNDCYEFLIHRDQRTYRRLPKSA